MRDLIKQNSLLKQADDPLFSFRPKWITGFVVLSNDIICDNE